MNINLNNLRNRTINATVKVLDKAKAPAPVDSIKARLSRMTDTELSAISFFIDSELRIRQEERAALSKETDNA